MLQPFLPVYYTPHKNRFPNFLCKIFLPSGHLTFSLNNPLLPPILWKINNMVTLHKMFCSIGWFRNPYVYFISTILFKVIRQRVSFIKHFMLRPTARIRIIPDLAIFAFYLLQHIIYHSTNHIISWYLIIHCIRTF